MNDYVRLHLIPASVWSPGASGSPSLAKLAEDALVCERRVGKSGVRRADVQRYFLLCSMIERIAQSMTGIPIFNISAGDFQDYLAHLKISAHHDDTFLAVRRGASFFPPGQPIADHLHFLAGFPPDLLRWRRHAFQQAQANSFAIVETFLPPSGTDVAAPVAITNSSVRSPNQEISWKPLPAISLDAALQQCMKDGSAINFSNYSHRQITEALNACIFTSSGTTPIQVRYADGSEGPPFPLDGLRRDELKRSLNVTLEICLISGRHNELDLIVDLSLLRNNQVNSRRTMAEQDSLATQHALELLRCQALTSGGIIRVFHTGLEPVVVGFYRAVAVALKERCQAGKRPLVIVPVYMRPGRVRLRGSDCLDALQTQFWTPRIRVVNRRHASELCWLPGRPMTQGELSALSALAPKLTETLAQLYKDTQYQEGSPWGPVGSLA